MARAELARFAVGRIGVTAGHSIDRREVGALFAEGHEPAPSAGVFFGAFDHIYSFFATSDSRFRQMLELCRPGRVTFLPFRPEAKGHIADAYLHALGVERAAPNFRLTPTTEDLARARHELEAAGMRPDLRFVAVFPGSGSRLKNWPAANFRELIGRLLPMIQVAVVLGPAEEAAGFEFPGVPTLRGLELADVAGIAQLAAAFVGNDSGVSHLAAATGTPGTVIFGPTSPDRWRPLGGVAVIARGDLTAISPAEVHALVQKVLTQRAEKPARQTAAR